MKTKTMDMETILLCAVIAAVGAFGIVAGAAAFIGVRFQECDAAVLTGCGLVIGGVLWGILLFFNRGALSKRG